MHSPAEPTPEHTLSVLLVEDDADLRAVLARHMRRAGHQVRSTRDGNEAREALREQKFDVMISDIQLPGVDGLTLLREIRESGATTDTILMTGFGSVRDAVTALKKGARDYILKPLSPQELLLQLARIAEERALRRSLVEARAQLSARRDGPRFVGSSASVETLREHIEMMAKSDAPVCITGESGTGKELVARLLHEGSDRHGKPFVAVNCAALPEALLEAELFGHVRGAFTGAVRARDGRFKAANGGTLLLDEVAEMPAPAQAKLLRVLEGGVVQPLGTNASVRVDVRVISATHRDLQARIAEGVFREDLYYRLNVLRLSIPPLRERRSDVPLLAEHYLERLARPAEPPATLSPAAWAALDAYPFPGNVRELAHALEHAVVLSGGRQIELRHLPPELAPTGDRSPSTRPPSGGARPLAEALSEFERQYLERALDAVGGNRTLAAAALGITRKALWEKLRRLGVVPGGAPRRRSGRPA